MSINEKVLIENLESINKTFNILFDFLFDEVLTGRQSKKLCDLLNGHAEETMSNLEILEKLKDLKK